MRPIPDSALMVSSVLQHLPGEFFYLLTAYSRTSAGNSPVTEQAILGSPRDPIYGFAAHYLERRVSTQPV